jgi:hypothetical protein
MKVTLILFSIGLLFVQCVPDDQFGLSPSKDITDFQVPGQAGTTTINKDSLFVEIPIDNAFDATAVTPSSVVLSNMASVVPAPDQTVDLTDPVTYMVTAEDGSIANWTVRVKKQGPEVQLPNSSFDAWYDAGGYPEPGDGTSSSVWSTANAGLALVGGYNTEPVSDGSTGFYAKMTSIKAPAVVRMAAATLFTGTFTDGFPSVSDPRSNIDFGTPFTAQPTGFTLQYKYTPGDSYEDANGNPLAGTDASDIYVLLEQHIEQNGVTKRLRVGTAWNRSSDVISDWTELALDITYGEIANAPDYQVPPDGYADPNTPPTHITVVFSSSALGDSFVGAIGSLLEVDNFLLVY